MQDNVARHATHGNTRATSSEPIVIAEWSRLLLRDVDENPAVDVCDGELCVECVWHTEFNRAADAADAQTGLAQTRDIENDGTTDAGNVGGTIRLLHDHRTATPGDLHCAVDGRNVDRAAHAT